jgi:YbbR domain-containing protein
VLQFYGDEDVLSNIKYIEVDVDVDGLDTTKRYTASIKKPNGVRYISETSTNVTISVESEVTKEIYLIFNLYMRTYRIDIL